MANRTLTFYEPDIKGNGRYGAAYYLEEDYELVAVHIHARTAPKDRDVEVNIFADGATIFYNRTSTIRAATTTKGAVTSRAAAVTTAVLPIGYTTQEHAEDFVLESLNKGTWVHCEIVDAADCKGLSVSLELTSLQEDDAVED